MYRNAALVGLGALLIASILLLAAMWQKRSEEIDGSRSASSVFQDVRDENQGQDNTSATIEEDNRKTADSREKTAEQSGRGEMPPHQREGLNEALFREVQALRALLADEHEHSDAPHGMDRLFERPALETMIPSARRAEGLNTIEESINVLLQVGQPDKQYWEQVESLLFLNALELPDEMANNWISLLEGILQKPVTPLFAGSINEQIEDYSETSAELNQRRVVLGEAIRGLAVHGADSFESMARKAVRGEIWPEEDPLMLYVDDDAVWATTYLSDIEALRILDGLEEQLDPAGIRAGSIFATIQLTKRYIEARDGNQLDERELVALGQENDRQKFEAEYRRRLSSAWPDMARELERHFFETTFRQASEIPKVASSGVVGEEAQIPANVLIPVGRLCENLLSDGKPDWAMLELFLKSARFVERSDAIGDTVNNILTHLESVDSTEETRRIQLLSHSAIQALAFQRAEAIATRLVIWADWSYWSAKYPSWNYHSGIRPLLESSILATQHLPAADAIMVLETVTENWSASGFRDAELLQTAESSLRFARQRGAGEMVPYIRRSGDNTL